MSIAVGVDAWYYYDRDSDTYRMESSERTLTRGEMIDHVIEWTDRYPVCPIEDSLAEDDRAG